jgi:FkbM family methyltransferase
MSLENFEKSIYSQNGEDGIIDYLSDNFKKINYFVEIGVSEFEGNCLNLKEKNIPGLFLDYGSNISWIKKEFITKNNILQMFEKYSTPSKFEFLSIDIDYNTYYILESIIKSKLYDIDFICVEYNGELGPYTKKVVPYNENRMWDGENFYGASLNAYCDLLKDYILLYCENNGVNAFFVKKEYMNQKHNIEELYKPLYISHKPNDEKWLELQTKNYIDILKNYNIKFDYILELGPGWGHQSVEFAMNFPDTKIYSFECNPDSIEEFKKNVNSDNVELVEMAIWEYDGEIDFHPVKNGNIGASSVFLSTKEFSEKSEFLYQPEKIKVACIKLDTFIEKRNLQNKKGVIWMDLQGAELKALKGLEKNIKNIQSIWTEGEYKKIYEEQDLIDDIIPYLKKFDFELIFPKKDVINKNRKILWFEDFCFIPYKFILRKEILDNKLLDVYFVNDKIRYGDNSDGGYVICNNLSYDCYISAGVGDNESFSYDFLEVHKNIPSFAFDGTIDNLPNDTLSLTFIKKNISNIESDTTTNLVSLVNKFEDVFLKMDIEGLEIDWIMETEGLGFGKFKQMVIEFHNLLLDERVLNCIEKINQTHFLIHKHGNNNSFSEMGIPNVIELTFLRKNEVKVIELSKETFPTHLDYPNNNSFPDIFL